MNEPPVTVWQYLVWWPCGWGGAGPAGRKGCAAEPRRTQTGPWCTGHLQSRCCSPGNLWLWPLPPSLPGPDRTANETNRLTCVNSLQDLAEVDVLTVESSEFSLISSIFASKSAFLDTFLYFFFSNWWWPAVFSCKSVNQNAVFEAPFNT